LPVSLSVWFWGKLIGRFVVVFLPVFLALLAAVAWGLGKGVDIPWSQVLFYTGFLFSLALCFLGIGMLISTLARSSDAATGAAFVIWLVLLLFMDLILLGVLIKEGFPSESVIAVALVNPLQVFRTASMLLFDPQLVLLGPSAYVILDHFGEAGYIIWALVYPGVLGLLSAWLGYLLFRRGDLP
jgi:ABC-2 type transport system permease protein